MVRRNLIIGTLFIFVKFTLAAVFFHPCLSVSGRHYVHRTPILRCTSTPGCSLVAFRTTPTSDMSLRWSTSGAHNRNQQPQDRKQARDLVRDGAEPHASWLGTGYVLNLGQLANTLHCEPKCMPRTRTHRGSCTKRVALTDCSWILRVLCVSSETGH